MSLNTTEFDIAMAFLNSRQRENDLKVDTDSDRTLLTLVSLLENRRLKRIKKRCKTMWGSSFHKRATQEPDVAMTDLYESEDDAGVAAASTTATPAASTHSTAAEERRRTTADDRPLIEKVQS